MVRRWSTVPISLSYTPPPNAGSRISRVAYAPRTCVQWTPSSQRRSPVPHVASTVTTRRTSVEAKLLRTANVSV
jgi:hypothetical protein